MRPGLFVSAVVVCLCFGGCGASDKPPVGATVPAKGKVSFQGKPLTKGLIRFEPVDAGREAHGAIQGDGTFVLTTFKEGDGAVKGVHKVSVTGADKQVRPRSKTEVEISEGKGEYVVELK